MRNAFAAAILCCIATACAGETHPLDAQGFVRDWLVGGAYPSYWVGNSPRGYATDFLVGIGGEAQAAPYPGLVGEVEFKADKAALIAGIGSTNEWGYKKTKVFPVRWQEVHWTEPGAILSLAGMFAPLEDHIVAYAFCYVESQASRTIKVRIGSDDDHKVWLNGNLLGGVNKAQAVVPDGAIYQAKLERGLNRLLVKVVDRTQGHGFCLALSDAAGGPPAGVQIRLAHPRRTLLAEIPGLRRVEAWERGFYAGFSLAEGNCFAGRSDVRVQVGFPRPGRYALTFAFANQGQMVATHEVAAMVESTRRLVEWNTVCDLPAGPLQMTVTVRGDAQAPPVVLAHTVEVIDLAAVKGENAALAERIAETKKKLLSVKGRQAALTRSVVGLQRQREDLYAQIEGAYLAERKGLCSAPPAIDEAMAPARTARQRICLNGDQWLGTAAPEPRGGRKIASHPPTGCDWHGVTLPVPMHSTYFRTRLYPLRNLDPKNPYGKVERLPGWSSLPFDPLVCKSRTWFRKELQLSDRQATAACTFVCENVGGRLTVYLNGTSCGEYSGNIGIVSIPLRGMKQGKNVLDLRLEAPITVGVPQGRFTTHWGLRGDLFLDLSAPVMVAGTEVKTSWRKGRIEVSTEMENRSSVPTQVRLDQYCVRAGRVAYRFGAQTTRIPAGGKAAIGNAGTWVEAEPWGIGGPYGAPVLYDLVSDVQVDGELVDRHIVPFGFREFWIAGTDFYLNGKRIILQGDVGLAGLTPKRLEVLLPLLRADGINTVRIHDSDYWSPAFFRACDRLGMLAYAQMYPILHERKPKRNQDTGARTYLSHGAWLEHPLHQHNLRNYARWVRMLRNHPSVVIAATDNEIFTQAWDRPESEAYNIRNDRLGAFYGRYVKSLDPSLVMTRDGDVGTWGHKGKWHEEPPCDTANYHYPDFHIKDFVLNWQTVYDFRPAVFGETLYCSYGAWNDWIGAIPSQVQKKAATVRRVASLYRKLGVPAQIYMGLSSDGYVQLDETGTGNPWGITTSMLREHKKKGTMAIAPGYPWAKIPWPSQSGPGIKLPAANIHTGSYGHKVINWFDARAPSHIRNAVNDAYRETLLPMPPLARPTGGECIVLLGADGKGKTVTAVAEDGCSVPFGVVADEAGAAWFHLPRPGPYRLECDGRAMWVEVPPRATYAAKPGFAEVAQFSAAFK